MGVWDKIKKETGIDKVSAEFGRASDKFESATGLSIGETLAAIGTFGGSQIPGAISQISGGGIKEFLSGGGGSANIDEITSGINTGAIDPKAIAAAYGYTQKADIEQFIKDPTGAIAAAEKAAARIAELQRTSAGRAILQQEQQLAKVEGATQPFRDVATDTALPTLSALALGGDVDFESSDLFKRRLDSGRENILENRAAGSGIKSSGTFEDFSSLASDLSAEDLRRFEQGNRSLLDVGLRAEDVLRGAESSVAGVGGQVLSNLGANLNLTQQNIALAEEANAATIGSGISSLSSLALLRGN